jgi:hypothetical protein
MDRSRPRATGAGEIDRRSAYTRDLEAQMRGMPREAKAGDQLVCGLTFQ